MSIALEKRKLGETGLLLTRLGFGASSIGAEFGQFDIESSLSAVRIALDAGINFIDTAAYYGRGMSEVLLGQILPRYPREQLVVSTKLGRYAPRHFDFSAKRVAESIDVSLERMRLDYLDIVFCHDIEYGDVDQVIDETLPALRRQVERGKVRYVGVSGYPMRNFERVIPTGLIDCFITYNHYTLQNNMALRLLPIAEKHRVGVINAAPFSARLLTNLPLPPWHKATPEVRRVAGEAALYCSEHGSSIEKLALQFSISHPGFTSCLVGSAIGAEISQWMAWLDEPIDQQLLASVQAILKPIHNWYYIEGRPENNDLSWPTSVQPSE
ncbi:MAG: aldo/keto reductase [Planctomycetes bacterium]|jgi:aryl-alcohol dehydrogenase-like predicted oxidoreductase|nr:aldo/keto reductase [Planctomycetota bacterium]